MQAIALICDFAEVVGGKLYIMGGGWTDAVLNRPLSFSLAARIEVPWDRTNTPLLVEFRLEDQDGYIVQVEGEQVVMIRNLEVGRPPGIKAGTPIAVPLTWTIQGLEVPAGRYAFSVHVEQEPLTSVGFSVHVPPKATQAL